MPTMGATLEAVALRSTLPTGRMTMRYQIPTWNGALVGPVTKTSATPKVPEAASTAVEGETAARKGGEAR